MENEIVQIVFKAAILLGVLEVVFTLIVWGFLAFLFKIRDDIADHGTVNENG